MERAQDYIGATARTTLVTSTIQAFATDVIAANVESLLAQMQHAPAYEVTSQNDRSTINGVVIGLLSSFGSAILVALIFIIVYFFRYTSSGRIILDRIGRPGEYDDEQAYAREEAEALEVMDDIQKTEYLRAKGTFAEQLNL